MFDALVKERGVTKQFIANKLGKNSVIFHDWSKGKSKPSNDDLQIVANCLNCAPDYLLRHSVSHSGDMTQTKPEYRLMTPAIQLMHVENYRFSMMLRLLHGERFDLGGAARDCCEAIRRIRFAYIPYDDLVDDHIVWENRSIASCVEDLKNTGVDVPDIFVKFAPSLDTGGVSEALLVALVYSLCDWVLKIQRDIKSLGKKKVNIGKGNKAVKTLDVFGEEYEM